METKNGKWKMSFYYFNVLHGNIKEMEATKIEVRARSLILN